MCLSRHAGGLCLARAQPGLLQRLINNNFIVAALLSPPRTTYTNNCDSDMTIIYNHKSRWYEYPLYLVRPRRSQSFYTVDFVYFTFLTNVHSPKESR